jgi:ribosomal protein S18 acetylase RimI-like enzyme
MGDGERRGGSGQLTVRRAGVDDAPEVARLLHDFNTEFDEPTPDVLALSERADELLADGEITVLLAGKKPDGIALLRFRPSIWTDTLDAYLEELYIAPAKRGRGMGRALLEAAIDTAREAGAAHIDLTTGETDTAARALYKSTGFTNREGSPGGPRMLYYERAL